MSDEDVPSVETAAEDGDESETIVDFLKEFLESKTWTTLLMTATFWALFQTDVCTMYFSKEVDPAVAYISLGWFIVFMFEMFLNFALGLDYGANKGLGKFTFYMMLDLVGTLSLIPDFIILFGVELPATGSAKMARAARTARIGASCASDLQTSPAAAAAAAGGGAGGGAAAAAVSGGAAVTAGPTCR